MIESASLGTTRSGSNSSFSPSPSQAGQAPCGALKLNSRGSISAMVKPETGQANFSEKTMRPSGACGGEDVALVRFLERRGDAGAGGGGFGAGGFDRGGVGAFDLVELGGDHEGGMGFETRAD